MLTRTEKSESTITITVTIEQSNTMKFALGVGKRRCREFLSHCTDIAERHSYELLIEKYNEIEAIIKKEQYRYLQGVLREKGIDFKRES